MNLIKWIIFGIVFGLVVGFVIAYKMLFSKDDKINETINAVDKTQRNIRDFLNLNPPLDYL